MATIPLYEAPLVALKKSLRGEFRYVKSSHLTEALAWSLGFKTHAALVAAMIGPEVDRPFVVLNDERFLARLRAFGYPGDPEFSFELMLAWRPTPGVVSTMPDSAYEIEYKTLRQKAWRNLMVCAINAALDQNLFTLRADDNRFPDDMRRGELFDFVLPNGLVARGSVADAGLDELEVHAAVNPKRDRVRSSDVGFAAGDAFGMAWLERRDGAWMQTTWWKQRTDGFNCRKHLLEALAALNVEPKGYGDRGKIMM